MPKTVAWLLALALVATGLTVTATPAAAAPASPQDTDTTLLYAKVRNDNISRWLRVMDCSGSYIDIGPQVTKSVEGCSAGSRAAWVQAGCTLRKDGKAWASSPPSGGHWKDFGWQPTTINFLHVC